MPRGTINNINKEKMVNSVPTEVPIGNPIEIHNISIPKNKGATIAAFNMYISDMYKSDLFCDSFIVL